jgi:intracellular multiplication protein IcmJ
MPPVSSLRPLMLSIRTHFSAGVTASSSAGLSTAMRGNILARDRFTCAYCGFKSERFQEIRPANPDGVARYNRADDWVTCCHMCDQVMALERTGMMGEGVLIWLPEMEQSELNHLVRSLYVARAEEGSKTAEQARKGLDILRARREDAKRRLGTDDPLVLATVLSDHMSDEHYEARAPKLEGIRLFSLDRKLQRTSEGELDRFPDMLAYWRSKGGPFANASPADWEHLAEQAMAG